MIDISGIDTNLQEVFEKRFAQAEDESTLIKYPFSIEVEDLDTIELINIHDVLPGGICLLTIDEKAFVD